uniref:Transposon Ty3-I Gag-Pol polyprotein n=1 Tax=Cajanus cajan TaxID=3821 RepID=A0A151TRA2_CAJCA|nr:Transposon Ty3-I Gag-Pol polyprotein [Cajanus cajan]
MPGIDANFICHRLAIHKEAKPVAQRKQKVGGERQKAIITETQKLLNAGFIREVRYTMWLANVVLVKKSSGKWCMCVDYTDLNKAFPKDLYPLPSIDRLVDGASGHALLSFLDAYSRNNQIMMYPPDEVHTSFITDRISSFNEFTIQHVPREQNTRVDLLSKLANTKLPGQHRTII